MSKVSKKQEKKRQQRLRQRETKNPGVLAYHGNKYRTEALVMPLMRTETAILEAYMVLDRNLTDHDVSQGLVRLIDRIRHGDIVADDGPVCIEVDDPAQAVVELVRHKWRGLAGSLPGRDSLVGIVRTILGSVENHKSPNRQSRNYLHFVERFLDELGVRVQAVPEAVAPGSTPAIEKEDDRNTLDADFDVPSPALPK